MTKKSKARLERDARAKEYNERLANEGIDENTCWEHLQGCYDNAKGLFVQYFNLSAMVADPATVNYFTAAEGERVANLMKSLAVDTKPLKEETERLYAKHQGKVGIPESDEDNYLIISLQQDYGVLLNNHSLTIMPVLLEMDELLQKALMRRGRAERAAKEAQDAAAQAQPEQSERGTFGGTMTIVEDGQPMPESSPDQTPTAASYMAPAAN